MLVHLSTTSPYVCDLSLGSIEQANRMAPAPTKTVLPYLEFKESFPRLQQVRTPLKLLAPDEVPMNTSTATTNTDVNQSRQASLQPVWYTEQTIVDDNIEQHQQSNSNRSSPCHRHDRTRSTLPTIASNSPNVEDEVIEKEPLSNKPSLMRKSSTFVIEQEPSVNIPSTLNESEKENDYNSIITSTQQSPQPNRHPAEPSEESFRALEHLLGLGSANTNLTMTHITQESPKSNHESLSLTIVTPTELINQTGASLHLSYAPAGGGGSLPSSQNILVMPTIESITDPSMNSTMPPPFEVDNSEMEEPSSAGGTVINPDTTKDTEESFHFTDDDDEEPMETPRDETNTEEDEDDNNFSFELNDFPNTSKEAANDSAVSAPVPLAPTTSIRAPTCADVAYRALVKARPSGRAFQPVRTESPLAKPNSLPVTVHSPTPASSSSPTGRVLRSSSRRMSTDPVAEKSIVEAVDQSNAGVKAESNPDEEYPHIELVEVVSVSEEDELEPEPRAGMTLNLTETKDTCTPSPISAGEADCSASFSSSYISPQQDAGAPVDAQMPVLSREFTFNTPTSRRTRASQRRSILINRPSASRSSHSLIPPILEQQATISEEEHDTSTCSLPSTSKTLLTSLSTNATAASEAAPMILQKSLAGSASPSPNPTPIITVRQSERLSSSLSPRRSINPLHSSTPSIRNKSLQMVSIGEQEQVSTTVPKRLNIDITPEEIEMIDNEQQVDVPILIQHVADEGMQTSPIQSPRRVDIAVQTTPSLDPQSRRRFQVMEQQTTPIAARASSSSSCQTTPIAIKVVQQTSPMAPMPSTKRVFEQPEPQQVTPIHSKAIVHLRRNVRFQFTPSTDARLAAKEKLEEEQRQVKPDIVISNMQPVPSDNEREEDTEEETTKPKKKTPSSKKKKASVPVVQTDESSEEISESPVHRTTRKQHQKEPTVEEERKDNDTDESSAVHSKKKAPKRAARKEKPPSPVKEIPILQPEVIVLESSPPTTAKRGGRKRANPKNSTTSPPETISPPEPVSKRVKTTAKTVPRVPSPEVPSVRARPKAPTVSVTHSTTVSPPEPVEAPPTQAGRKPKKSSSESSPTENPPPVMNNKRKHAAAPMKKGKRRLHSVEQDEGLNTADEEEAAQTLAEPMEVTSTDLSQEERDKIEALTVAELKARLTAHHEALPKGARKAELVTLLIKIETNLLQERKTTEVPADPPSRKTRRKK